MKLVGVDTVKHGSKQGFQLTDGRGCAQAGHQALDIAVLGQQEDLVRLLLAEGADVGNSALVSDVTALPVCYALVAALPDVHCAWLCFRASHRCTSQLTSGLSPPSRCSRTAVQPLTARMRSVPAAAIVSLVLSHCPFACGPSLAAWAHALAQGCRGGARRLCQCMPEAWRECERA